MTATFDAIVIGAGHNGLVTAAYLGRAGLKVLVLERREVIGGAAVTEQVFPGFKFDTAAHRIGGLHPGIIGDLDLKRQGLEIVQADPTVFAPAADGRHLVLWRDPKRTAEGLREISQADADAWIPFSALIAKAAAVVESAWSSTPPNVTGKDPRDLWSVLKLGAKLRGLGKKDMIEVVRILPMAVSELLGDWFESDVLKGTLAAAGVTGLMQGPMAAGTVYNLLHHQVGAGNGTLRPTTRVQGGTGELTRALAAAAREHGVDIRTSQPVERVIVKDGRATGVALSSGEEFAAARVVSNADPRRTFFDLVGPTELEPELVRKVKNIRFRGCCAKVNLALQELPRFTGIPTDSPHLNGVISISPSLDYVERAYDDAKYGAPSRRPHLEVSIPSVTDPSLAEPGKHVMSIVAQYVPYRLKEGEWDDTAREELGNAVVSTLSEYAPNLESAILHRQVLTPLDLEETYGLPEGNINHGEHTLDQLLFMRPVPGSARYRTPLKGLYLCGAGTHPGGGVTGFPGYNAAREILRDGKG
jgi:phytoene dehydrogenase-like protein